MSGCYAKSTTLSGESVISARESWISTVAPTIMSPNLFPFTTFRRIGLASPT